MLKALVLYRNWNLSCDTCIKKYIKKIMNFILFNNHFIHRWILGESHIRLRGLLQRGVVLHYWHADSNSPQGWERHWRWILGGRVEWEGRGFPLSSGGRTRGGCLEWHGKELHPASNLYHFHFYFPLHLNLLSMWNKIITVNTFIFPGMKTCYFCVNHIIQYSCTFIFREFKIPCMNSFDLFTFIHSLTHLSVNL